MCIVNELTKRSVPAFPRVLIVAALLVAVVSLLVWWWLRAPEAQSATDTDTIESGQLEGVGSREASSSEARNFATVRSDGSDAGVMTGELASVIQSLVHDLSEVLWAALQRDPQYQLYLDCIAREREDADACRGLLSDALYHALDVHLSPALLARAELIEDLKARWGESAVIDQLMLVLLSAESETDRLTILSIATADQLGPRGFPLEAYAAIEHASVPEQTMLLEPHHAVPIIDESLSRRVSEIASAAETDTRTRRAAIKALGHGETAHEMADIVDSIRARPEALDGVWLQIGEALGRCSNACADTVESLARGTRNERRTAYEAVLTSLPGQAGALQAALVRAGEPADADIEERQMRMHAIRLGEN